jgi:DNA-directed RNA polymerase specialized sigma24 family protein
MTPMRLDTILANLDPDEREELRRQILDELTHSELVDALTHLWDRVGNRISFVVREYQAEIARLDAEIAEAAKHE